MELKVFIKEVIFQINSGITEAKEDCRQNLLMMVCKVLIYKYIYISKIFPVGHEPSGSGYISDIQTFLCLCRQNVGKISCKCLIYSSPFEYG